MKQFTEPSTWAGVAGVLQALKAVMPQHAAIIDGLTMVAGSVAIAVREQAPAK